MNNREIFLSTNIRQEFYGCNALMIIYEQSINNTINKGLTVKDNFWTKMGIFEGLVTGETCDKVTELNRL